MSEQFKQKLSESLDRVVSETQFDFHEPVRRPTTHDGSVEQAIHNVLVKLNREHYAATHGYDTSNPYGEDFADRLREEWIDRAGSFNGLDPTQALYDIAQDLIASDAEDQHERNMSDPPISADEQYRAAGRQKYGPGLGW